MDSLPLIFEGDLIHTWPLGTAIQIVSIETSGRSANPCYDLADIQFTRTPFPAMPDETSPRYRDRRSRKSPDQLYDFRRSLESQ